MYQLCNDRDSECLLVFCMNFKKKETIKRKEKRKDFFFVDFTLLGYIRFRGPRTVCWFELLTVFWHRRILSE